MQPDGKVSPTESVAAYVRDDAVDAVVHYCDGGHLCELSFSRGAAHWRLTDMNANFAGRGATLNPAAGGPLSAHVRSDGVDSVNYVDSSGELDEMYLTSDQWGATSFTDHPDFGGKGYTRYRRYQFGRLRGQEQR